MIRTIMACSKGVVGVVTAMVLPLLLGFSSMGVEVSHWYLTQRQMQGAADAAAISAAAQYIRDQIAANGSSTSTTYQTVGQTYASTNGFSIPTANVCLVPVTGPHNCDPVLALDSRPLGCTAPPCIVAEITQDTLAWLTTQKSVRPTGTVGAVNAIPTPILKARSVVSVALILSITPTGSSCILTLANARNSIQVRGSRSDIQANCGLLIDGGRNQYPRTPTISSSPLCSDGTTPPCGGLTLSGSGASVHITNLTVASSTPGPAGVTCRTTLPQDPRCLLYTPANTPLPPTAIFTNITIADPFANRIFTKPAGVVVTSVATTPVKGNGYTTGSPQTFTVLGGAGIPAKFTTTVASNGAFSTPVIVDPGQYTVLPSNPVLVSGGGGSGAQFTISSGNCLPGSAFPVIPVPNRAYCSIPVTKNTTFPSGIYYAEGGDAACQGFCITTGNITVSTASGGATFVLTNVAGGSNYATFNTSGNQPSVSLVAPTTNINADGSTCPSGCANTTSGMIVFQDRNAPETTALDATNGNITPVNSLNSLAGCGNSMVCRTMSGTLYFPKQTLNFSGNGIVQGTCFGVVSKYLDVSGNPSFQNGCLPGTTGGGGSSVIGGTFKLAQ